MNLYRNLKKVITELQNIASKLFENKNVSFLKIRPEEIESLIEDVRVNTEAFKYTYYLYGKVEDIVIKTRKSYDTVTILDLLYIIWQYKDNCISIELRNPNLSHIYYGFTGPEDHSYYYYNKDSISHLIPTNIIDTNILNKVFEAHYNLFKYLLKFLKKHQLNTIASI